MKGLTKTIFVLVGFLCISQLANSQTVGKAAWMIGGQAGFTSTKQKNADKSSSFIYIQPNIGYFFADDFAVGLAVNFQNSSFNGNSNSSTTLGPYARYYVTDPIFVQVSAAFGLDEGAGTGFGAAVGYSWFLNNGVAIEPAVFFDILNNDGDTQDYTIFGLSVGIQAFAHHDHGMPE